MKEIRKIKAFFCFTLPGNNASYITVLTSLTISDYQWCNCVDVVFPLLAWPQCTLCPRSVISVSHSGACVVSVGFG